MRSSLKFKAAALVFIITASVACAVALEAFLDFQDAEEQNFATANDITRVVERQTRDTITYVDHTLDAVSTLVEVSPGLSTIRQPAAWRILRSYCATLIGCHVIGVIDPDGQLIAQTGNLNFTPYDVSDRTYFQRARDSKHRYIDMAVVSRLPGNPILVTVAKPVYDSAGKLLAVVAVGLETTQLTSFYSLFGFSVAPTVAIYKGDGSLVARNPGMAQYVGKSDAQSKIFTTLLRHAPAGIYDSLSPIDGKRRLAAYRSLPDLDLVIFAGIEKSAAFASWKVRTVRRLVIVASMLVLIWGALVVAYRAVAEKSILRRVNTQLDDLASKDPLTGIGNRRIFDSMFMHDWSVHARSGAPLSLVMLDVDCFKLYNDHYGHVAGDTCLQKIAKTIDASLQRKGDLVARYGGEEFVVLLDCGYEGACLIAEQMRTRIEQLQIPHAFSEASSVVTASFGVASTESIHVHTSDDLIGLADRALYAAKSSGRNRVENAETLFGYNPVSQA